MTRPMVSVGIPFLACLLVASFLSRDILTAAAVGLAAALLGAAFLPRRFRLRVFAFLAAMLFACIHWLSYDNGRAFAEGIEPGCGIALTGVIEELEPNGSQTTLTLRVEELRDGEGKLLSGMPRNFRAIVYVYGAIEADYFDLVRLEGKTLAPNGTPTFDYARYLEGMGIGMLVSASRVEVSPPEQRPLLYWVKSFRRDLLDGMDRYLLQPAAGLVKAVLLGDTDAIDERLYVQFQQAGVTHAFVVSGLHINLVAGCVFALLKRLRCPPWIASLIALAVIWLFAALTGFGLPALRASVMMSVLLAGGLVRRPADSLNSLFLAGVGITLCSPAAILSGSFQLSFLASLGAITLASPIRNALIHRLRVKSWLGKRICGIVGVTLGCNLAMLPATYLLFGGISLIAPLANLIVIPLLPVLLVLAMLLLAFSAFPPAAKGAAFLVELIVRLICDPTGWLAELPAAYLGLDYPFVDWWLLLGTGCFLAAVLLRKRKPKVMAVTVLLLAAELVILLAVQAVVNRDVVEILPVVGYDGGSVALLHDGTATVLALNDDSYTGELLEACLRGRNVRSIDSIVLFAEDTREPSGIRFLAECDPVQSLLLREANGFAGYADTVPVREEVRLLREGSEVGLFSLEEGSCELLCTQAGMCVLLRAGNTRVCITDSEAVARETNCEILIFGGKNYEFCTHPTAKCVILINEPKTEPEELPAGVVEAYETEVSLRLYRNGDWSIREGS